ILEVLPNLLHLGTRIEQDVGLERIPSGVVLVVLLGGIEAIERNDLGDDRAIEDLGPIQLLDVGLCDTTLLVVAVEDDRAVLASHVWTLPVLCRGIVRDREEDFRSEEHTSELQSR